MASRAEILEALREVIDPELMMNIVDLGLVYRVEEKDGKIEVDYTLTSPGCPLGAEIEERIVHAVEDLTGQEAVPNLVWTPRWGPDYMTDEAKISLGFPV
jgi:metal-sulfur cluster biosynthetic enzyme